MNSLANVFFALNKSFNFGASTSPFALDCCLCNYIRFLWRDGESRGLAGDTLSGITHFVKPLRGQLKGAWRVFSEWQINEPSVQAPPLPYQVLLALVDIFLELKLDGLAAGLAVCFHGFLRTSKILSLLSGDVILGNGVGSVVLRVTKKKRPEILPIDDSLVLALCRRRKHQCSPGESFCGVTPHKARSLLAAALDVLGLAPFGYRWYSVRRGGATYFSKNLGAWTLL